MIVQKNMASRVDTSSLNRQWTPIPGSEHGHRRHWAALCSERDHVFKMPYKLKTEIHKLHKDFTLKPKRGPREQAIPSHPFHTKNLK